jgi:hypothetical protein
MVRTFALTSCKCLESTLDPTPPLSTQLSCAHAFVHVREYTQIVDALILNTPIAPFDKTTGVLCFFHPLVEVDIPFFVDDFHFNMEVTLDREAFIFALVCSPHFFFSGPLSMVYELL